MAIILQDKHVVALEMWFCYERDDGTFHTNLTPPNKTGGKSWNLLPGQNLMLSIAKDGTLIIDYDHMS